MLSRDWVVGTTLACPQPKLSTTVGWLVLVFSSLKMSAHLHTCFIFIKNSKFTKSFNSYPCLKLQQEVTQAACKRASRVEEVARERCQQMFVDLNSHCRIPVSCCCTLKLPNRLAALVLTGQAQLHLTCPGRHTRARGLFLTLFSLNPGTEGKIRPIC